MKAPDLISRFRSLPQMRNVADAEVVEARARADLHGHTAVQQGAARKGRRMRPRVSLRPSDAEDVEDEAIA